MSILRLSGRKTSGDLESRAPGTQLCGCNVPNICEGIVVGVQRTLILHVAVMSQ